MCRDIKSSETEQMRTLLDLSSEDGDQTCVTYNSVKTYSVMSDLVRGPFNVSLSFVRLIA